MTRSGSSPLTRGKLGVGVGDVGDGGLIPAHAGKTPPAERSRAASRAHPRSRGENNTCRCVSHDTTGSSPLTRGKHTPLTQARSQSRLIPAHAGKTIAFAA